MMQRAYPSTRIRAIHQVELACKSDAGGSDTLMSPELSAVAGNLDGEEIRTTSA